MPLKRYVVEHARCLAERHHRLIKFVQVGILNTTFGYSVFTILYLATGLPRVAVVLATIIGVLFNYLTTGRIVFGHRSARALIPFALGYAVTLALNILLLDGLIDLGVNALVAQALILPGTVSLSYLINSRLVFRPR